MSKLLLVEDDANFARLIMDVLEDARYAVDCANSAEQAIEFLRTFVYQLVIVDWELPGKSGTELFSWIRAQKIPVPTLMLTSRKGSENAIVGLDAGGDDYLEKPCNKEELLARIRALLRRGGTTAESVLQCGTLKLFHEQHRVQFQDKDVDLSPREFELLRFFLSHPDTHFTAEAIFLRVWANRDDLSQELVRMYVKKLRDKLTEAGGKSPIETISGRGYALVRNLCD